MLIKDNQVIRRKKKNKFRPKHQPPDQPPLRGTKEYLAWRRAVLKRDGYICQDCKTPVGKKGRPQAHVHHKIQWKDNEEQRLKVENGITLCRQCHASRHRGGGDVLNP